MYIDPNQLDDPLPFKLITINAYKVSTKIVVLIKDHQSGCGLLWYSLVSEAVNPISYLYVSSLDEL